MLFLVVIVAWGWGVIASVANGNRKLPLIVLLLGAVMLFAPIGVWRLAGMAILAAVIWIANKADTV